MAVLYHDANNNGIGDFNETQFTESVRVMEPGDSTILLLKWRQPLTIAGDIALVDISHLGDERPEDNSRTLLVRQKFVDTGVVINEFMYTPRTPYPEWVELFNRGEFPVDLQAGPCMMQAQPVRLLIPASFFRATLLF